LLPQTVKIDGQAEAKPADVATKFDWRLGLGVIVLLVVISVLMKLKR
jgi:hypothetical protein